MNVAPSDRMVARVSNQTGSDNGSFISETGNGNAEAGQMTKEGRSHVDGGRK